MGRGLPPVTWHPPFFTCGECGGEIGRWPVVNRLRQEILDWRHRDVGPYMADGGATVPHRPVLGTKAHTPKIPERVVVEVQDTGAPMPAPPPEMPARPALAGDLPSPAEQMTRLAESHGWTVQAWIMRGTLMDVRWKPMRVVTTVALWLDRDGHRLVVSWATRRDGSFEFEHAFSLGQYQEPLNNTELKRAIKYPRAVCEDCQKAPSLHPLTEGVRICKNQASA
jgi:hypothetical protein